MMLLSKNMDIKKLAQLANLNITAEQTDKLSAQLEQTIDYVAKLNEINTNDVPPTAQVAVNPLTINELREDICLC